MCLSSLGELPSNKKSQIFYLFGSLQGSESVCYKIQYWKSCKSASLDLFMWDLRHKILEFVSIRQCFSSMNASPENFFI